MFSFEPQHYDWFMPKSNKAERTKVAKSKSRETNGNASPAATPPGNLLVMAIGALGVVYGDIGTSPLYTIPVCFAKALDFRQSRKTSWVFYR